jgi:hypothetical protein
MILKTYDILLDLEKELYTPSTLLFSVSRNDYETVQLTLKINQDGAAFDLTGKTVELAVKKPSGLTVYQQAEVTEATAGEATLMLSIQAYVEYGVHTAEVYIRDSEQLAVTSPFYYSSRSAVMEMPEVESVNDWSALIKALFAYDLKPIITDGYPTETPEYVGQMAFDGLNSLLYVATDLTAVAWQQLGAGGEGGAGTEVRLGEGAPTTAPVKIGQLYVDTLAPAAYIAIGAAADTWRRIDNEATLASITWGEILDKPLTFPADPHTHATADITGLDTALAGKAAVDHTHDEYLTEPEADLRYTLKGDTGTGAPAEHTHEITEVTGLTDALAGKADTGHGHVTADITGLDTTLAGKAAVDHTHDEYVTEPEGDLRYKLKTDAPTAHTHATADITGLDTTLAGKAEAANVYTKAETYNKTEVDSMVIEGGGTVVENNLTSTSTTNALSANQGRVLNEGLQGKADTAHTHATTDITGLDTTLAGKAAVDHNHDTEYSPINHNHDAAYSPIGHGHATADITGLDTTLAGKADTGHGHATADITGLDTALAGKAAVDHTHAEYVTETEGDTRYKLKAEAPTAHNHAITDVTGLDTALAGKAAVDHNHDTEYSPIGHTHAEYVTETEGDTRYKLKAEAPAAHTHAITDVTGLDTALAGKAAVDHNHDAAYSAIGHTHDETEVTLGGKNAKTYVDDADNYILYTVLDGLKFSSLTQAEYDALVTKDANTVYFING